MLFDRSDVEKLLMDDPRVIAFIYSVDVNANRINLEPTSAPESQIAHLESLNFNFVSSLYSDWKRCKFENQSLEKLKDEPRLIHLFLHYLYSLDRMPRNFQIFASNPYIELLALCDYCNFYSDIYFNFNRFLGVIEACQTNLTWLDLSNSGDVSWALNYIYSNSPTQIYLDRYKNNPSRTSSAKEHQTMFIYYYFDTLALKNSNEAAELFILKMKRAYSQRKYRNENSERTPSNYMLSKDVKIKLKEIAKKERLKLNETIELLINEAHIKLE